MKRIICAFLTALMIIGMIVPAFAVAPKAELIINDDTINVNGTFDVTVKLTDAGSSQIVGVRDITYDSQYFELLNFEWIYNGISMPTFDAVTGVAGGFFMQSTALDGNACKLTFKALDATDEVTGRISLKFTAGTNGADLSVTAEPVVVTVIGSQFGDIALKMSDDSDILSSYAYSDIGYTLKLVGNDVADVTETYTVKYKATPESTVEETTYTSAPTLKEIGEYTVYATLTKKGFNAKSTAEKTFKITNASFNNPFIKLGDDAANASVEYTYDGKSRTVTVANTEGAAVEYFVNDVSQGTTEPVIIKAGTYKIKAVLNKTNYDETTLTTTITVNQKEVTVENLVIEDKFYDGDAAATLKTGYALEGVIDGDTVTLTVPTAFAFSDANAGTNKAVTATGTFEIDNSNYKLTQPADLTGTIKPRVITVTPRATQKLKTMVDDPEIKYDFTPALIGSDKFEGALTRENPTSNAVGKYKILRGTLDLSDNYEIEFEEGKIFEILDKVYTHIEIGDQPDTTTYIEGQTFNPTGMTIKAFYKDADNAEQFDTITSGYTCAPEVLAAGTTKVTVSYADKTADVTVTVTAKQLVKIFHEIDASETSFKINKTFTRETLKVYAEYDNGVDTKVLLTEGTDYTVDTSAVKMDTVGEYTVVITHKTATDKTTSYNVDVVEKALTKIEVSGTAERNYIDNGSQVFNPAGIVVTAYYDNDTSEVLASDAYSYAPTGVLTVLDDYITFSYTFGGVTKTADYDITVSANDVTGIALTKSADKTDYIEGQAFIPDGTIITLTYLDGTTEPVSSDYAVKGIKFVPANVDINTKNITVSLGKLSVLMPVNVVAKKVTELNITAYDSKAVDGDTGASVIMTVAAKYDNGDETADFKGYTVSPAVLNLDVKTVAQTIEVFVQYKNPGESEYKLDTVEVYVVPCEATNATTGENYETFEEAVEDAAEGDVIEIKLPVEVTEDLDIDKDLTIKTGDNKITTAEDVSINTVGGSKLTFDTTGASEDFELTINNKTVTIEKGQAAIVVKAAKKNGGVGKQIMNAYAYLDTFYRDIVIEKTENGQITGRIKNKIGDNAKFTITPADGYVVADVLVDNVSVGAVTEYKFVNIREDHTITAVFEKIAE